MKRLLALSLLLVLSCTRTQTASSTPTRPEEMVQLFVQLSSEVKTPKDKQKLASLCQGRLRKAIDSLSDDAFMIAYGNQPIKVKQLQVIDTTADGNLARVHYQVRVENPNGQDATDEVNEREVEMLRVDGQWYLEAIRPKGSDQIAFTRGMIF